MAHVNPTTIIPAQNSTAVNFFDGTMTATTTGAGLVGSDSFSAASFFLNVTAATGTSPTLDVYIQKLLPDRTTWCDIAHFAQLTGSAARSIDMVSVANAVYTPALRTLAAGSAISGDIGSTLRYDAVIGGTNPSFTFTLDGELYA